MDIGIVFGGGFARGAAQLGFLRGMLPFLNRSDIKLLSCASSGALTGLALSADRLDYGEQIYRHTNITSISNLRLNLKNKLVDQVIDSLIKGGRVDIPLYVTGTCLNTLSTHYFYLDSSKPKEELYEAMNITLTFPFVNGVFRRYGKKFYLDGGATDNIPVYPFLIKHVDLLLILHNYPRYLPPAEIVNSDTVVIDIDVGTRCGNSIKTYSFDLRNINRMLDISFDYGREFGQKVLSQPTLSKIKEAGQRWIRDEIEERKKSNISITAAIFFNKLQQSRGFKI